MPGSNKRFSGLKISGEVWGLDVGCKVPHRLGRRTKGAIYRPGYLPLSTRFKTVRGEDSPKRTISRARRWDVTDHIRALS